MTDDPKPWSIRGVHPEVRNAALAAAKRDGVTIGEWLDRAQYHEGEGWIELGWWPELLPHLTKYKLQQANALRSIYSWRLLELFMHYQSTGVAEYTIEDFCTSMEATEKQKQNFAKIRTKIIEPAVKELIEKDGWLIEWQPMKTGRKVSKLRFKFKRTIQPALFPPP